MAAPYTATTDLTNLIQTAYDRKIKLALRSVPMFRMFADTKPAQQTQPGSTIVFQIHKDLAPATTPLQEVTEPAGVSLSNTDTVTVTLNEYGNYSVVTKRLQKFNLDSMLESNIANILAFNQADSVDQIVRAVLDTSTNVVREIGGTLTPTGGAVTGITASDLFKSKHARYVVAKLRGSNIVPKRGNLYSAVVHPDVSHDLRAESGTGAWRFPHEYVDTQNVYAGEIGNYEGCVFVESPRCGIATGAGADGAHVYNSYFFGQEALAEAVAEEFHSVVNGTIADPLDRKMALGWYGIAGWSLFRPKSMYVVKTASSIPS